MYPTESPEALRSFVRGQQFLSRYWTTQSTSDLEAATEGFLSAERADPRFSLASFYAAVTENEARHHDAAISRLRSLSELPLSFRPEAYVHLAYAHAKRYTDADYRAAEIALDVAERQARADRRSDLLPVIDAYRVFLFALIGGRSKRDDQATYLERAVELGKKVIAEGAPRLGEASPVVIEARNGLGIAFMRRGQFSDRPDQRADSWRRAQEQFETALRSNPNIVRVLQNLGTLRIMQGDAAAEVNIDEAKAQYQEALVLYLRTIQLRPHDQFPHYRTALLYAKLGEWDNAKSALQYGRQQPGAVKDKEWAALVEAIEARNPSRLPRLDRSIA